MSNWFCKLGGTVSGPFTLDELIYLRDREKLSAGDLLRDGAAGEWVTAANVALLFPPSAVAVVSSEKQTAGSKRKRAEGKTEHSASAAGATSTALLDEPASESDAESETAGGPPPLPSKENERRRQVLTGVGIGILVILLILLLLWLLLSFAGMLGTGGGSGGGSGGGDGSGSGYGSGTGSGGGASDGTGRGSKGSASRPAVAGTSTKTDSAGDASAARDDAAKAREKLPEPDPTSNALIALKPDKSVPPQEAGGDGGRIGGGGSGGGGGGTDGNSFFGVKSKGRRFVYVIDCSSSMAGSRFAKACEELKTSISRLKPHQSFYVYFFNDRMHPMPEAEKLLKATPENVTRAHQWIDQWNEGGGTEPQEAMLHAIALKPDAIFFLTDGGFRPIADSLRQANERHASINTICFEDKSGERQMQQIATENRGDYRFVP